MKLASLLAHETAENGFGLRLNGLAGRRLLCILPANLLLDQRFLHHSLENAVLEKAIRTANGVVAVGEVVVNPLLKMLQTIDHFLTKTMNVTTRQTNYKYPDSNGEVAIPLEGWLLFCIFLD